MSTDADTTPTDQKIVADGTPTGQVVVVDTARTGRNSVDVTPTQQQVLTGAMAVGRGSVIDGRWRTDRCLASGGYGDVWEAVDVDDGRRVAIKILRTNAGNNDPSAIARMRQEAEILQAIDHPSVVDVYGFGSSPFGHFLVMELLQGQAIDQLLITRGPVPAEEAIPLVRQLLQALQVAHAADVFHRDLKPENIIIVHEADGRRRAKLVDFGIAKATRLLGSEDEGATLVQTLAGGFMGTPRYTAPEQAVGDKCGPNIDLFALGLVVAEWLTGKIRLDATANADVVQQLLGPEPIPVDDVPYRWREFLSLMLKKNPARRLPNAEAALAELERLVVNDERPEFLKTGGGIDPSSDLDDVPTTVAPFPESRNATTPTPLVSNPAPASAKPVKRTAAATQTPAPSPPATSASAFAGHDGPLELDYARVERTARTAVTPHPSSAPAPVAAPPASAPPQSMRIGNDGKGATHESDTMQRQHPRRERFTHIIFMIAVTIISFAGFVTLFLWLAGLLTT